MFSLTAGWRNNNQAPAPSEGNWAFKPLEYPIAIFYLRTRKFFQLISATGLTKYGDFGAWCNVNLQLLNSFKLFRILYAMLFIFFFFFCLNLRSKCFNDYNATPCSIPTGTLTEVYKILHPGNNLFNFVWLRCIMLQSSSLIFPSLCAYLSSWTWCDFQVLLSISQV